MTCCPSESEFVLWLFEIRIAHVNASHELYIYDIALDM